MPVEKWRVVENVVAAVQRSTNADDGWCVTQNVGIKKRGTERRRQVDVLVEHVSGFRIGIDIKAERRPLDIEVVEQLCCKLRKLELNRAVIVSSSGFTESALEEAEEEGIGTVQLEELERSELFKVVSLDYQIAEVTGIEVVFEEGKDKPSLEALEVAELRTDEGVIQLVAYAQRCAAQVMRAATDWVDGETYLSHVKNENQAWKGLISGDKEWPAPSALKFFWGFRVQQSMGCVFKYGGEHEALSAVVTIGGVPQQITMVALPGSEGGFQISTSIGVVRPPKRNV